MRPGSVDGDSGSLREAAGGDHLRIAVVAACPFPERRGTPVRIQRIAEGLNRRGHEVHVVTYPYANGRLAEPLKVHRVARVGTRYRPAPGPSPAKLALLDPLLVGLLRRVLREVDIDIIHAHHYEGLLVGAVARAGLRIPLVYDAHTLLTFELPDYAPQFPRGLKKRLGWGLDRRLPPMADHVVCVTRTIKDRLLEWTALRDDEVTVISNGVEIELFDALAPPEEKPAGGTVVFTGNLAAYQGIDLLLEAFQRVVAERPRTRLRIVTESSFEPYEARARELGIRGSIDVLVRGFDAVPALLASSDVAVNPRLACSGIPLKLLNYMAASKPVVSFEGSAPGIEHRRTGWLAADGDVENFARGILTLLADSGAAREMGDRSRRHVEAHHSWESVSGSIERTFHRVLERVNADPARRRPGRNVRRWEARGSRDSSSVGGGQ